MDHAIVSYAVQIKTGPHTGYRWSRGWDREVSTRAEAEAIRDQARKLFLDARIVRGPFHRAKAEG